VRLGRLNSEAVELNRVINVAPTTARAPNLPLAAGALRAASSLVSTLPSSQRGGNVGIGFAVPINMARLVMAQIVEHGRVHRGRIGISIKDLSSPVGAAAPAGLTEGAVIAEVSPGSPAEQGGIQKADIVVAANGTPVRNGARLRNKPGLTPVGERVHLTVKRKDVLHNLSVEVGPTGEVPRAPSSRSKP
jgi:serine protease Do